MTITKDNPEALVEDVMAGVRESLNNDDSSWITENPVAHKAFLLGALTALSKQVDEAYLRSEMLKVFQLSFFGGVLK